MNFLSYYTAAFKKVFDFDGIASRREYWSFALVNFIVIIILSLVSKILILIYALIVIVPSISLATRRLHDAGMSGWWQLITFIPYLGALILCVLLVYSSKKIDNKYLRMSNYE
ncbi:DUF805 domain-containing protein [Sulfurospirillum halorespirans]|uniref:Putative membrane protein n=1 Tax=Sulfurospirillum halorespirans DSM 13726 TaxID=1193502 RepID=A0A1D7TKS6_9BACT|nr:DUF805 domain-containing protein [Sulfurospirillum halorespirans]AOO65599.1 putative membrane protein [Sulfurospirillum halorespirans DSM 13726]